MLHGEGMQAPRRFPCHNVVMSRLAADDAAKRHASAMPSGSSHETIGQREAEGQGDLERARHGKPLILDVPTF